MKSTTFASYFLPSAASALAAVGISLMVLLSIIAYSRYHGSKLQYDLFGYQSSANTQNNVENYDDLDVELKEDSLVSILPLLVLWGLVGYIVYLLSKSIFDTVGAASRLRRETGYVNAHPREILQTAMAKVLLRVGAAIAISVYTFAFVHYIMPYALSAGYAATADGAGLYSIIYMLLCVVTIALSVHLYVVLARFLFLRPRLFTNAFN